MAQHTRILIGLLLGAATGVLVNLTIGGGPAVERIVTFVADPIGRVWLNALIMIVIPLILSTLALGVAGLGTAQALGRIGALTIVTFVILTVLSVVLGIVAVNVVRPGAGLDPAVTQRLMDAYGSASAGAMGFAKGGFGIQTFVDMVPRNPIRAMADGEMLAVIVFALFLGVGLTRIPATYGEPLRQVLESIAHVSVAIIDIVMRAAPVGVFALIFSVTARFGFSILVQLLQYVLTVVVSLAIFNFVVYPMVVRFVAGRSPLAFMRHMRLLMLTAFSTSSSNATLPTTLRVTEELLGVRPHVARFVVPLGATMNSNGSALFEGVTVLFVAQVFGVTLSMSQQVIVVVMAVVAGIGTAGVPGGTIPLLMMVLDMVDVPMEGIALVLGVDRILDMCRTTVNVVGDSVTAVIVDRFVGRDALVEAVS